ncbi:MAG: acyl-CoA dehydrogenase [Legionellaceae bacterium]|nr:acyl-CoA dehydrogenase [Legionellaceae bacterium]
MAVILFLLYLISTLVVLYRAMDPIIWIIGSVFYLITATFSVGFPLYLGLPIWIVIVSAILIQRVDPARKIVTNFLFKYVAKSIPNLSKTEEIALNAGDTWFEESIFRGEPNWTNLAQVNTELTVEEEDFLRNETSTLCAMLDEWAISQEHDLSPEVWTYLKTHGFLGLVIPKSFGGKGFSARAHSEIVMKIASRSGVAAVTMMVPNSLGPAELLVHYGTEEQKKYYLPRLAIGEDIPCFALTEPEAGSDATSIKSSAVVVEKKVNGINTLGLNITLNKRWITLAPVATLLGVAVKLQDPDGLLNGVGDQGITCVLIPRDTKNIKIGNRHLPAQQPFMNGTIRGKDIFVPITNIIGGQKNAGHGWEMLVECLSIGRSISLPALSAGSSGIAYLTSGAFARIRRQFNTEIGQFEGIEEKLAEIAGLNYLLNATRLLTLAAVNEGKKPSVASALTKYFNTELARVTINNAMDVHGGRAVVSGPRNYLANYYSSIPIFVTVEGANIMSRNLLIFGQGAIACHPFIRDELITIKQNDKPAFSKLVWQHIDYFMRNFAKMVCSVWTAGVFIEVPDSKLKADYRRLARLSYTFAWLADLSLMYLGGALKRKERLSARLADAMSYLYMAMAVLHYAKQNEEKADQLIHAKWATSYCFYHAQRAMINFCHNFPSRILGCLIRLLALPFGQTMHYPDDTLDHQLADCMMQHNEYRKILMQSLYLSGDSKQPVDRIENTLALMIQHHAVYNKIGKMRYTNLDELQTQLNDKLQRNELNQNELDAVMAVEIARWDAIQVDEFSFDSIKEKTFVPVIGEEGQ